MSLMDEVRDQVIAGEGVVTLEMWRLREAVGAGKLGTRVRGDIARELAARGLGHVPGMLPTSQSERVRLYLRNTRIGEVLEAAATPDADNDAKLRRLLRSDDADVLSQVRRIVCC